MPPSPPLHSTYDEHMASMFPDHQPTSPEHLMHMPYALGATDDTLHEHLAAQNTHWDGNSRCVQLPLYFYNPVHGGELIMRGLLSYYDTPQFKPAPDDPSVLYYPVPSSALAIRIWARSSGPRKTRFASRFQGGGRGAACERWQEKKKCDM
ncbi:hypothetical protein BJ138DRAFT_1154825 [Hygrophoropsis aurantiaca]|uniref:Uncharacterized protein n=1 Tax=Hygrophoropsis aurantiaca TaxID=72124 RepID=A0ACB8A8D1_9AGAM|nr:hypothetical protein BJ138DRAFT_1154825 [Hygrophoropsis aurantiaca]